VAVVSMVMFVLDFSCLSTVQVFNLLKNILGGVIPKKYILAFQKGLEEALISRILYGYLAVDI